MQSMYKQMLNHPINTPNMWLWQLKLSLKIKNLLWYIGRAVILTKDNLAKRNWKGSLKCPFCNHNKNIQPFFFECSLAKIILYIVRIILGIKKPGNMSHMIGTWLREIGAEKKRRILVGISAMF